ncbi:sigma-70 family RNA polymerase sigma factor [Patescibacteria group bacterium]|nr:sigma-70 family RNA polymerase sigma factor [Patescibacteria group bacterium]
MEKTNDWQSPIVQQIFNHKILANETILILIDEYKKTGNNDAKDKVILHNQRLIGRIIRQHPHWSSYLSKDDMLNVGNIGLLRAIQRFEKEKGLIFSKYAVYWIKQAISYTIAYNYSRLIRISSGKKKEVSKYKKEVKSLISKLKRIPCAEEIAQETGFSLELIFDIHEIIQPIISLETPRRIADDKEDSTLSSSVPNKKIPSQEQSLDKKMLAVYIEKVLEKLTSKEKAIIEMRFGLVDGITHTLEEIGREFNVSRERIRQIEAQVFKKIRRIIEMNFPGLVPEKKRV